MDHEELIEALQALSPDAYFEMCDNYPLELIDAEVALLDKRLQEKKRAFDRLREIGNDPRPRVSLDLFQDGYKEYIVIAPGRLIRCDGGQNQWMRENCGCDVLVCTKRYPQTAIALIKQLTSCPI